MSHRISMAKITGELEHMDHHPIASLFLSVDPWKLIRPSGEIDLLLGIGLAEIFPFLKDPELHHCGNLQILTSEFGDWYMLEGTHELLNKGSANYCHAMYGYSQATLQGVTRIDAETEERTYAVKHCMVKQNLLRFGGLHGLMECIMHIYESR